ncbi:MAG: chromosome partitioning protein [Acetobacteraceae bacterium]
MSKPLHLVEQAALHLRQGSSGAPESALLPEAVAQKIAASVRAAPLAEPSPATMPSARLLAIETLESAGMITSRDQRDRIAEEFRIISQHVLVSAAAVEPGAALGNLVLVTSARPGEGKSFAALNLAASLALGGGREVILVDADIRVGSLTATLGLAAEPGLLDLVPSPAQLAESTLVRSRIQGLQVMPIGGGSDPSGRALISAHNPIAGLLTGFAPRFAERLIVVDAPACLCSSDPSALAQIAGQALLVVEAEKTRRREIEAALDLIDACANIKLLLNKVQVATRDTFGVYS